MTGGAAVDPRPAGHLLLGAAFGLATGVVEVLHMAILKYGSGIVLRQPIDLVWMAPASYLVLFGVPGLGLAALARRWPRVVTLPAAVFAFALVSAWSQFLLHPSIHRAAVWLVCAGLALQAARSAARRQAGLLRLARRAVVWLGALVVVAGASVRVADWTAERRALAGLPAARAGAPNVLLIVLDTVRADHLGFCGYHRDTTPHLDALAERAVVFDRAFSTSPWTLPAHATMFTGRYAFETSADWLTPLDGEHPTLAEVLAEHGYRTGGFVGNLVYCLRENGVGRGFARYDDILLGPGTLALSTAVGRKLATWVLGTRIQEQSKNRGEIVTSRLLRWLERRDDRPFFAFLNLIDAHDLYLAPGELGAKFGARVEHLERGFYKSTWTADELQGFVDGYDGCIAYVDSQVQRVLAWLDQSGLRDDTLVVVTSDHGEQFGEHGLVDHGNSLYRPLLHVPLVLSFEGRLPQGRRVADVVSLRDLPATILDLIGVEAPLPGHSLAALLEPGAGRPARSPALSEVSQGIHTPPHEPHSRGDMVSLVRDGRHLIVGGDGALELYDLDADPGQTEDLARTPAGEAAAAQLRAEIARIRGR